MGEPSPHATVVVIGAGQAGLSAAYHLQRRGFRGIAPVDAAPDSGAEGVADRTFVVLDANPAPGGAWQHRWPSLTMATVNGIFDLPGYPQTPPDRTESSSRAVPRYFAEYERAFSLPIHRPVRVLAVRSETPDDRAPLAVQTDHGEWTADFLINATGTWDNPLWPQYPGAETFAGTQLHTGQYTRASAFAGQRVAVVGAGISGVQLLEEISRTAATTLWYTRREPVFLSGEFTPETGRDVIARVTADAEAGRPGRSVVSYTGLTETSYVRAARERGVLVPRPMFRSIVPDGVIEPDGTLTRLDAIVWATGFRPAISHLSALELQGDLGGVPVTGTRAARDARVHLIGFGPSQSTVGANRAGRDAVRAIERALADAEAATPTARTEA